MNKVIGIILLAIFSNCDDDTQVPQNDENVSDAYELNSVVLDEWILSVEVSYSGGCEEHEFSLIWPKMITMQYPPKFNITLSHNANGDSCEAYITETLDIDLSENPLGISLETLSIMELGVVNGSNEDQVYYPNN